jgi:ethanolaminephosphotransferase
MLDTLHVQQPGWMSDTLYNLSWTDGYMGYGGVMVVANTIWRYLSHLPLAQAHINIPISAQNVQKARHERGQRARKALLGLLPYFGVWALIPIYLALNPLILHQHLVPFLFFIGIINAYSVGQMIVAHLTKSRFPYYNVLTLPLIFGVLDSIGPILQNKLGFGWPSALGHDVYQVSFMFSSLGLAIGVYGSFVVDVIYTICDYLDIWCLRIKHPYVPEENGGKKHQ